MPNSPAPSTQEREYFPKMKGEPTVSSSRSSSSSASATPLPTPKATSTNNADPAELLSSLRQTFLRTEQSLYSQLAKTSVLSLNNVRRAFLSAALGADRRLQAWQKKHLSAIDKKPEKLSVKEPEWWGKTCHVVPGGNIIVREDDWGSIIAFTMR